MNGIKFSDRGITQTVSHKHCSVYDAANKFSFDESGRYMPSALPSVGLHPGSASGG